MNRTKHAGGRTNPAGTAPARPDAPAARDARDAKAWPDVFVIEDEQADCAAIVAALAELGLTVASFAGADQALAALDRRPPKIIFLDIALSQSDAIDVIAGLGERNYTGVVQLISANRRLLEPLRRIAERRRLAVRPPLPKPLDDRAIARIIAEAGIGADAAVR